MFGIISPIDLLTHHEYIRYPVVGLSMHNKKKEERKCVKERCLISLPSSGHHLEAQSSPWPLIRRQTESGGIANMVHECPKIPPVGVEGVHAGIAKT